MKTQERLVRLSHRLTDHDPTWPGAPILGIRAHTTIADGDLANTHTLSLYTHHGTHCDLPIHFLDGAPSMSDIDVTDMTFRQPVLLDIPARPRQLFDVEDFEPHRGRIAEADLLLIRSGWQRHRARPQTYAHDGPGLAATAAAWLRRAAPDLRGIALDWLSVCSLHSIDDGAAAHRILLQPNEDGHWVTIFEDTDLAALGQTQPTWVLAAPLLIEGIDGSPCTIIAAIHT